MVGIQNRHSLSWSFCNKNPIITLPCRCTTIPFNAIQTHQQDIARNRVDISRNLESIAIATINSPKESIVVGRFACCFGQDGSTLIERPQSPV